MLEYREKRNYPRMQVECPARFEIIGGVGGGAIVKNLSGGGVLMWVEQALEPGARLQIEIRPVNQITPPMSAEVQVLRCHPVAEGEGSFAVACQIERVLG